MNSLRRTFSSKYFDLAVVSNSRAAPSSAKYNEAPGYPIINHKNHQIANKKIKSWSEDYQRTPLVDLPSDLALSIGVDKIYAKLESNRCGLSSFKALGGGYAVDRLADEHKQNNIQSKLTVSTASAGNHGIAVAWGAARRNVRCLIYVHQGVGEAARKKMRSFGAQVVVCEGDYSASVERCRMESEQENYVIVQDVSWEGYEDIPKMIWQGYSTVAAEICEDLEEPPTHILLNSGVGGFACAMVGHMWENYAENRPRFICVEPEAAECLCVSAETGIASTFDNVQGLTTIQTGLDCTSAAPLAWEILNTGVNDFVSISDDCVAPMMQLLADEYGIVGGASGVAGLGVVVAAGENEELFQRLKFDANSRIVVVICEGAVDEELYEQIVGRSAESVTRKIKK